MSSKISSPRRGRPKIGEREQRRRRVLDAAFAELVEHGYEKTTMLGIAQRAGASKETLYSWFDNRDGLFSAMIEDNADHAATAIQAGLARDAEPATTLTSFSVGLLTMLTGERSIALNRAAMSSPDLAAVLLASGRHRVGPLVERYLDRLNQSGFITIDDPAETFRLLYGLLLTDTQIRVLLGESPPTAAEVAERAAVAVDRFLLLVGTN